MNLEAGQYIAVIQFAIGTPHNISLQLITNLRLLLRGTILVQIDQRRISIRMTFQPGRVNFLPTVGHLCGQSGHNTRSRVITTHIVQIVGKRVPITDFEGKVKIFVQFVAYTQPNRNSGRYERIGLVIARLTLPFRMERLKFYPTLGIVATLHVRRTGFGAMGQQGNTTEDVGRKLGPIFRRPSVRNEIIHPRNGKLFQVIAKVQVPGILGQIFGDVVLVERVVISEIRAQVNVARAANLGVNCRA